MYSNGRRLGDYDDDYDYKNTGANSANDDDYHRNINDDSLKTMEEAVLLKLNLNGSKDEEKASSSWQNDFSPPTEIMSFRERARSNEGEIEADNRSAVERKIQKDLEFVLKHAPEADPNVVLSLLHSKVDNPRRLEWIMAEVLDLPNALEIIKKYRNSSTKAGVKRTLPVEPKDTKIYLEKMREMFPDADLLFLITECQHLKSWEDFTRFVSTVMLGGLYRKKKVFLFTPEPRPGPSKPFTPHTGNYRNVEALNSEEEISSSNLKGSKGKKQRKRGDSDAFIKNNVSKVDVVDLSSDDTELYEPPEVEELLNFLGRKNNRKVDSEPQLKEPGFRGTRLADEIDRFLQSSFRTSSRDRKSPESPTPGPSGLGRNWSPQASAPDTSASLDDSREEKSTPNALDEQRLELDSNLRRYWNEEPGPSSYAPTSFGPSNSIPRNCGFGVSSRDSVVSSPEISTTFPVEKEEECDLVVGEDWLTEQLAVLIRIFPNTDPSYLKEELTKMNESGAALNEFVSRKLENNDMPSRETYEKKLEMEELQNRYTENFSIEDFLKAIPDPWKYFTEGNRNCLKFKDHSLCYLKSIFRRHYTRDIQAALNNRNCNLYLTYHDLKSATYKKRGHRRSEFECNHHRPTNIDIQFLQEVAFIENEEKIREYLETEKIARQIKFEEAKRTGSLLECQCCYDAEILVEDIFYCPKDHAFCRSCIIRSVEVEMGYGRFKFSCLFTCEEKFTLACLQNALTPELFSKVIQAIQMEEIRAAEIEDLVQCPFCNYATIMPPEEKVLTCLNPECLKESCRLCKELNHIPLRCEEVEKSEEVKMRTYIENKMTEALVRTCYKCGKKFVKEDGCNKMTCTCGAKMCYVCRRPVSDYSHFNGQGGTDYHKCPLYSSNDELHVEVVRRIGEKAKAEIMRQNPNTKLLHDPTVVGLVRTNQVPMPGVNRGAALDVAMRAAEGNLLDLDEDEPVGEGYNRDRREIIHEAGPCLDIDFHRLADNDETESGDGDDEQEDSEAELHDFPYHRRTHEVEEFCHRHVVNRPVHNMRPLNHHHRHHYHQRERDEIRHNIFGARARHLRQQDQHHEHHRRDQHRRHHHAPD